MGVGNIALSAVSGIVILFSLFWASTRVVSYFFWTQAQSVADFEGTVIPAGTAPEVLKEFTRLAIAPLYGERQMLIRLHVASGALMTLLVVFQVVPQLRQRFYTLHKYAGKVMFLLWLITMGYGSYIMFVLGMVPIGPGALHLDVFALGFFFVGGLLGWGGISSNNVALHRRGMLLLAVGVFANPLQRLLWAIISQARVGGPYTSYKQWEFYTTNSSAYLACSLLALFAAYQIFFVSASPKDLARRGGKTKKQN